MNVCFELFMQDQLKVLKQFETKVYISFQVVVLVCKSEILKKSVYGSKYAQVKLYKCTIVTVRQL